MSHDIRLLPISKIKIGDRHRKDLGDLATLAASIDKGLLQPIGVTPEMELIWGYRRLLATRDILKQDEILCRIVQVSSIAQGELTENTLRKDFTPSERVAIVETLRGYGHGGDRKSDQRRNCDLDRLTTKEAAGQVGFCRDDYYRAKKVVSKGIPELVEAMDAGRLSISAAAEIAGSDPEVQRNLIARGSQESAWVAKEVRRERRKIQSRDQLSKIQATVGPWTVTAEQAVVPCDAVITDPPFGVTKEDWDKDIERTTRAWASAWNESNAHFICTFFSQNHLFEGRGWLEESLTNYVFVQLLVAAYSNYNKRFATPGEFQRNWNVLFLFRRKDSKRWVNPSQAPWSKDFTELAAMTFTTPNPNFTGPDQKVHPFQKSVACMRWLVENLTLPGELVVDPFSGSGTTGIAAVQLGRRAHLIEISSEYRTLAEQRLATYGRMESEPSATSKPARRSALSPG